LLALVTGTYTLAAMLHDETQRYLFGFWFVDEILKFGAFPSHWYRSAVLRRALSFGWLAAIAVPLLKRGLS
jgi:hypothetical protein